jgi:hypothetical protein
VFRLLLITVGISAAAPYGVPCAAALYLVSFVEENVRFAQVPVELPYRVVVMSVAHVASIIWLSMCCQLLLDCTCYADNCLTKLHSLMLRFV